MLAPGSLAIVAGLAAALWASPAEAQSIADLGALPGGSISQANGINANGPVVDSSETSSGGNSAFYAGGSMINLNLLPPANSGWVLHGATAINDSGQIVGAGINSAGETNEFLLDTQATVTSLSPSSTTAGGAPFPLTVTGTNFVSDAAVNWNGAALKTLFVSETALEAAVPASLIATVGTASVTVTSAGATSAGLTFTINLALPPTITSLSPSSAVVGGATFTLTVTGTDYVLGAKVNWNSTALKTLFVSATTLQAVVPASNIATTGTASVTVTTTGGTSTGATFAINPLATVTNLSRGAATADGAAFTLSANSTGFLSGARAK